MKIRHEMRDKTSTIKDLMRKLSTEQNIKNLVVTKGTEGSLFFNKNHYFSTNKQFITFLQQKITFLQFTILESLALSNIQNCH